MKAIRVTYQVRPDFVATNEANIRAVMDELRALGDVGLTYSAFRTDATTFVHLVVMDDASKADIVPGLAAFATFRAALKGGAVTPPSQADWTLVGTRAEALFDVAQQLQVLDERPRTPPGRPDAPAPDSLQGLEHDRRPRMAASRGDLSSQIPS